MRTIAWIVGAGLVLSLPCALHGAPTDGRSYVAGKFMLSLGNQAGGFLRSVEGGGVSADVIDESPSSDGSIRRHIGKPKYDDFTIAMPLDASPAALEWISQMLARKPTRRSGEVVSLDGSRVAGRRTFRDALITEVSFPACDATSKDPAYMTLKFSSEATTFAPGDGSSVDVPKPGTQKAWLPSNFRLTIDGLTTAATKVNKIEALVVKQKVVENPVGELRDYEKEPANLEIPNLVITVPPVDAGPWIDWAESFIVRGKNGQGDEKSGALVYLEPNKGKEIFTLDFFQVGVTKLTLLPPEPEDETTPSAFHRVRVELYVEEIRLRPVSR